MMVNRSVFDWSRLTHLNKSVGLDLRKRSVSAPVRPQQTILRGLAGDVMIKALSYMLYVHC